MTMSSLTLPPASAPPPRSGVAQCSVSPSHHQPRPAPRISFCRVLSSRIRYLSKLSKTPKALTILHKLRAQCVKSLFGQNLIRESYLKVLPRDRALDVEFNPSWCHNPMTGLWRFKLNLISHSLYI